MKKIAVEEAIGRRLCHDVAAILENGTKRVQFSRGHMIQEEDIPRLLDMGKTHIFVWEPGKNEVHEEDAGFMVAKRLCGANLEYSESQEGKFQIEATCDGIFLVGSDGLVEINCVNDYSVVCKKGFTKVKCGETVGTAGIIPLVTAQENVDRALALAQTYAPIFSVRPYKQLKVGIIIIGSELYHGRIPEAFEAVLRKKLAEFSAEILGVTFCDDDLAMVKAAVYDYKKKKADLILLAGGMSVDPDDVTPTVMRECCTRFISQGMPVQPGNMLSIAYMGNTVLMGVPEASIQYEITSLDLFLPRVFAGIPIEKADIVVLGEAGLL